MSLFLLYFYLLLLYFSLTNGDEFYNNLAYIKLRLKYIIWNEWVFMDKLYLPSIITFCFKWGYNFSLRNVPGWIYLFGNGHLSNGKIGGGCNYIIL